MYDFNIGSHIALDFLSLVCSVFLYSRIGQFFNLIRKFVIISYDKYISVIVTILYFSSLIGIAHFYGSETKPIMLFCLYASFILLLTFFTMDYLSQKISDLWEIANEVNAFEGLIVIKLMRLIVDAENGSNWNRTELKIKTLATLEELAINIERNMVLQLPAGDANNDVWFHDSASRIASAIRERKKWLLLPMPDTQQAFVNSFAYMLVNFMQGNWNELEQADVKPITNKQRWYYKVFPVIRGVIVALLPISGLIAYKHFYPDVEVAQWISGGFWGWAGLNMLLLIDPDLAPKISMFKSLPEQFLGQSK